MVLGTVIFAAAALAGTSVPVQPEQPQQEQQTVMRLFERPLALGMSPTCQGKAP